MRGRSRSPPRTVSCTRSVASSDWGKSCSGRPDYTGAVADDEAQGQLASDQELDAEAQARRRLALAQIRQYPDPVLRMRARDVESFDADLGRLVERMVALMEDAHGVGLAATQVGVLQRLFVFKPDDEEARA